MIERYNQRIYQYLKSNPMSSGPEISVGTGYWQKHIDRSLTYLTNNQLVQWHRTEKGTVCFYV